MPRYQKSVGFAKANVGQLITTSSKNTVETVTASTTLDACDSGKTFVLSHATVVIAVTLPSAGALGAGWKATFLFGLNSSAIHTVGLTSAANIWGSVNDAVGNSVVIASGSSFVNFTATAVKGDQFTLECDGTNLFWSGSQQTAAGVSVTA